MDANRGKTFRLIRWMAGRRRAKAGDHPQHHGSRSMMQAVWTSLITATLCAALIGYLSNVLSIEDLTIFYRAPNQAEIGQGKFKVTFAVSNMGRQGALIEEFGLIQVVGTNINTETENCSDPELLNDISSIQPGESLIRKTKNELSYHLPTEIYVENRIAVSGSVALNSGTARTLETTFTLRSFDVDKKAAIICPVVKYFDRSGHSITSVCPGWRRDGTSGTMSEGIGNNSRRLLPREGSFLNTLFWRKSDPFCVSQ